MDISRADLKHLASLSNFSMSDEELSEFSRYMVHEGVWVNGIHSVIHNPRQTWLYIGCLQALRHGW